MYEISTLPHSQTFPSTQLISPFQTHSSAQVTSPASSDTDYPEQITHITLQLRKSLEAATQHLVEAGSLLLTAKSMLVHGQFQNWLFENFNMSSKTANRLMSVAKMVQKLDPEPDLIEKLANLDLGVLYAISAKSTTEEVQRQVFDQIAQNQPISCEMIRLIKKNIDPKQDMQHLEDVLNQEKEFLQFVRVLKQFSGWIDQHQPQLYSPQQELKTDLKQELKIYAQKLKAATDIVNKILEKTQIRSSEVLSIVPQVPPNQKVIVFSN